MLANGYLVSMIPRWSILRGIWMRERGLVRLRGNNECQLIDILS